MKKIIMAFFVAVLIFPFIAGGYNPFIEKTKKSKHIKKNIIDNTVLKRIIVWQGKLNKDVSDKIEEFKKDRKPSLFILIIIIIFVYGALHALGPGHGKIIISAWVISSKKKYSNVALASVMSALFHALSAALIVSGVYFLLGRAMAGETIKIRELLQLAAGIIIFVIGAYMLIKLFIVCKNEKGDIVLQNTKDVHPLLLAAAVGLIPCPSTSVILIFSFSFGLVFEGFLFILFFAAGMALTQIAIATGVWHLYEKTESLTTGKLKFIIKKILPSIGAVILLMLGAFIILPFIY